LGTHKRPWMTLAVGAAVFTLVTACSSAGKDTAAQNTPPPPSEPAITTTRNLPLDTANLQVVQVPGVGEVVSDDDGFILYRYDKDTAQPPKSNCVETECVLLWSPVLAASGNVNVKGIDKSLIGTVERGKGLKQVTLGGWPLYRYTDDEEVGSATGNGVDGLWFAIKPDGQKAKS
jgi:predicted lipoprotein with Yx(FWY)xxD motif